MTPASPSEPVSGSARDGTIEDDADGDTEEEDHARQRTVLRVSGALLLAFAACTLVMNVATGNREPSVWIPLAIDIAVGAGLVRADARSKSIAIFRASVGLLFGAVLLAGALSVGKHDFAAFLLVQALVSFSLLLLLWGTASRLRLRVGAALGVVALLLDIVAAWAIAAVSP